MDMQGVIFDLDGVIVSTDHFHYKGWKQVADEEGIYFDEVINNRLRGVSRNESLAIILERSTRAYSEEEKEAVATRKNEYYKAFLAELSGDTILPGVMDVLEECKKHNMKIAIGSSSKNTPLILERIGLSGYFDVVVDGNCISKSKPDPEVFLLAAQGLGLQPEQCAVVEDAKSGIDAACAAGMMAVAVHDAFGYEKADYSLKDIRDLLVALGVK